MFRFLFFTACCIIFFGSSFGQSIFYQRDASITIGNTSSLYIDGTYQTNSNINNGGTITITGNLINEGSTGIFENQTGIVVLNGTTDQQVSATEKWQFNTLILNKASGDVKLDCNIQVDSLLTFNGGNLNITTYQVDLGYTGDLSGENESSRIYASTGIVKVKKVITDPLGTDDIGGLGLFVQAPSSNFGMTEITRGHQSIAEAGAGSIARWFYVKTSTPPSPAEYVDMRYFDSDGTTNENRLQFYTRKPTATRYFPTGGVVNITTNEVLSIYFLNFEEEEITLAPTSDNSTCAVTDSHYVEAVFLVPSDVTEDDTVYFVNLSLPAPDSINSIWNSGDGFSFSTEDVWHPYADPGNYTAGLSVHNAYCSDASSKLITVRQNSVRHTNSQVVSELINSFVFYPNPIERDLNWLIDFTDVYESNLVLLDVFGRIVFQKQYHQRSIEESKDFSSLPSGLYLLKLEVMGRMYTYRIVKL